VVALNRELDAATAGQLANVFVDVVVAPAISPEAAEIIARIGSEQAAKGINLPLADLIIGACALKLGYAIGTHNARDFNRLPGLEVLSL
jgi:predicted nucleic acid-binding protein